MNIDRFFSYIDVFNVFLEFLDLQTLLNLMRGNKQLLNVIGKSKVWMKFGDVKKIKTDLNFYKEACEALQNNPLISNSIRVQDYYRENYYCFRYYQLNFKGVLSLSNLLRCSSADLERMKIVLNNLYSENPEWLDSRYETLIKNIDKLKMKLQYVPQNILDLILLPVNEYFLCEEIIINVHNNSHNIKIASYMSHYKNDYFTGLSIASPFLYYVLKRRDDSITIIKHNHESEYIWDIKKDKVFMETKMLYNSDEITEKDWDYLIQNKKFKILDPGSYQNKNIYDIIIKEQESVLNDDCGVWSSNAIIEPINYANIKFYFNILSERLNIDSRELYQNVCLILRTFGEIFI
jgi:hypothetical protein